MLFISAHRPPKKGVCLNNNNINNNVCLPHNTCNWFSTSANGAKHSNIRNKYYKLNTTRLRSCGWGVELGYTMKQLLAVVRMGLEPGTSWFQVRHPNHSTKLPFREVSTLWGCLKFIAVFLMELSHPLNIYNSLHHMWTWLYIIAGVYAHTSVH